MATFPGYLTRKTVFTKENWWFSMGYASLPEGNCHFLMIKVIWWMWLGDEAFSPLKADDIAGSDEENEVFPVVFLLTCWVGHHSVILLKFLWVEIFLRSITWPKQIWHFLQNKPKVLALDRLGRFFLRIFLINDFIWGVQWIWAIPHIRKFNGWNCCLL